MEGSLYSNKQELLNKVNKTFSGWKSIPIFFGKKLIQINSHIFSMSQNLMGCFPCSKNVITEIENSARNLYLGEQIVKYLLLLGILCKPKDLGAHRLCIRNTPKIYIFNCRFILNSGLLIGVFHNVWILVKYLI